MLYLVIHLVVATHFHSPCWCPYCILNQLTLAITQFQLLFFIIAHMTINIVERTPICDHVFEEGDILPASSWDFYSDIFCYQAIISESSSIPYFRSVFLNPSHLSQPLFDHLYFEKTSGTMSITLEEIYPFSKHLLSVPCATFMYCFVLLVLCVCVCICTSTIDCQLLKMSGQVAFSAYMMISRTQIVASVVWHLSTEWRLVKEWLSNSWISYSSFPKTKQVPLFIFLSKVLVAIQASMKPIPNKNWPFQISEWW